MSEQLRDYLEQEGITQEIVTRNENKQMHTPKIFIDMNKIKEEEGRLFSYSNIKKFNLSHIAMEHTDKKFISVCTIAANSTEELLEILKDYTENVSIAIGMIV